MRNPKPLTQRRALSYLRRTIVRVTGVHPKLRGLNGRGGMCLALAGSAGRRWELEKERDTFLFLFSSKKLLPLQC